MIRTTTREMKSKKDTFRHRRKDTDRQARVLFPLPAAATTTRTGSPVTPVDEFRSVVRVQTQKSEGQHPFDLIQGLLDGGLPLPQQSPRLCPGGLHLGDVKRVAELSCARIPGMRDQIDFGEAWGLHVPAVGLHWDVMLQQVARLGASVNPPSLLVLLDRQSSVHLPRTDREQLFLDLRA